jgi:hypothetical protein
MSEILEERSLTVAALMGVAVRRCELRCTYLSRDR